MLAFDDGFDLRSRCVLRATANLELELVRRGPRRAQAFRVERSDALVLLAEAMAKAAEAGLEWELDEIVSAAVALWAAGEPRSAEEEDALRWLERQPAPQIACSDEEHIAVREGTTHLVPVNDARAVPKIDTTYASVRAAIDGATALARLAPGAMSGRR